MADGAIVADAAAAVEVVVEVRTATRIPVVAARIVVKMVSSETGAPNILTCPQESGQGAVTISNSGVLRTFVRNQPRVHGRMFLPRDLNNEPVTSPKLTKISFKTRCTSLS